ncbi:MAG TPA: enoyl-CoA hydratase-related protein [bacterium]|nr:enoyl-CoA hydratase-related protein [bacterium]
MSFPNLLLEKKDFIATVTVNREKALNALNPDVLKDIQSCFSQLSTDNEVRAVVVTGAGDKAFVAGADISAMSTMSEADAVEFGKLGHAAMNAVDHCRKPVIAAVNGFCLGGGMELALSCDFIYASEKAKLGLPEVNLGLFPGWGGTQRLARLVGKGVAKELIFTAKVIGAADALAFGIVNKVSKPEDLLNDARAAAAEICKKGPVAVQLAKQVINEGFDQPLPHGLEKEKTTFPKCFTTQDLKEGLAAFLEKRPAKFQGK